MSFFERGTPQEREKEARKYLPDIISNDVFRSIIVKYMEDLLLTLSVEDLCKKLQDQKEGPGLIDEIIENEVLLKHLLVLTAGTEKNKDRLFWIMENEGRHGQTVSENVCKQYHGGYLIELCSTSVKLKNYLLENADALKKEGLIDDTVIADIKNIKPVTPSYHFGGRY